MAFSFSPCEQYWITYWPSKKCPWRLIPIIRHRRMNKIIHHLDNNFARGNTQRKNLLILNTVNSDNTNRQGRQKTVVVNGSSSYRGNYIKETQRSWGNCFWFELAEFRLQLSRFCTSCICTNMLDRDWKNIYQPCIRIVNGFFLPEVKFYFTSSRGV